MGRELPSIVFERTAARAEDDAASNLGGYRLRLWLFAMLGYCVIFALLLVLIALVGALVYVGFLQPALLFVLIKIKLVWLAFPVMWILFRAVWVRIEAPEGYKLRRNAFPLLYAELDDLRRILKTPRVHEVILTPDFNAGVVQTPRLGIFGWQKNTVLLGLELLLTLSPEQARAVLGHELGHLSRNHSRFNGWIYRVRDSWYRLMAEFDRRDAWGARMLRTFFDWYAPRFAAYSFVLARINEYEADAVAAELVSPRRAGEALINTGVTAPYVDTHYWQAFFREADSYPAPPCPPWEGLKGFLRRHQPAADELQRCLEQELQVETDYADTHPSLSDPLAALKVPAELPPPVGTTAAEAWLGESYQRVIDDFDSEWQALNTEGWKGRFEYVSEGRKKLQALAERPLEFLSDDELWEFATLTETVDSDERAFDLFKAYHARHPQDPDVLFVLGRMLCAREDESCLDYLQGALSSLSLAVNACEIACHYLYQQGRRQEAQIWEAKARQFGIEQRQADLERETLTADRELMKLDIDTALHDEIARRLQAIPGVGEAWLAQVVTQYYRHVPVLIVSVRSRAGGVEELVDEVLRELAGMDVGCTFFAVSATYANRKWIKRIKKLGKRVV